MQRMRASLVALLAMAGWTSASAQADAAPPRAGAFSEPGLVGSPRATNRRLFIALFDCSWKNASKGPSAPTTVAWIHQQLTQGASPAVVATGYVSTDCARDNWLTHRDHGEAFAANQLAAMDKLFAKQSEAWRREDPQAGIRLLTVGGSWGALQGAEFSMMVAEVGLRSPTGEILAAPRKTAQALALLAPTGYPPPELRLPSSLIIGFQLNALDEERPDFQSLPILGKGISTDGRFASLDVPGSLSDVCGGYRLNGLSAHAANLLVDYINGLSTAPFLHKKAGPDDPRMNVVHRSQEEGR